MTLLFALILSFLTVRGFRYTISEAGLVMRNTLSFVWLILMAMLSYALYRILKKRNRRLNLCVLLFGVVTGIFYVIGAAMEKMGGIVWIWSNTGTFLNVLNLLFAHILLYSCAAALLFPAIEKVSLRQEHRDNGSFSMKRVLLYWGLLTLVYLPWYLVSYPGGISLDTADQINDAITTNGLRDHHSAFLTLMMRLIILPVRAVTGSVQRGIGIVTFVQMLIVTFVFAFTCEWIRGHIQSRPLRVLVFLWYAIYPVNASYSVTLWKDIPFSVCFLVLLIMVDAAGENAPEFFSSRGKMVMLTLTLTFLPLMRHNGILITIITGSALLIYFRKYWKQLAGMCGSVLIFLGAWRLILCPLMNVEKISSGQVLSVLQQQMARAMAVHHDELTPKEMAEFTQYFDIEDLWTRYNPIISDSVKRHFLDERYDSDPGGFFALWVKLGRRYPLDYLEAFLANNYGYWFPETNYWIIHTGVNVEGWETADVHASPILNIPAIGRVQRFLVNGKYTKTPLLPLFFSRGACWWLWIFCGCFCLYRNPRKLLLFLPGFSLWLGILISPVYNEYRYVYGLFISFPVLAASVFDIQKKTENDL